LYQGGKIGFLHINEDYSDRRFMNKSQLIEALAKEEDLALKKAEEVVNTVFGDMEKALANGERVEIRGFGSFKIKKYEGYQGRNPKTGEIINVSPKKLPFFKVGKELKERVDIS
jgi:integration host factor subunit beta